MQRTAQNSIGIHVTACLLLTMVCLGCSKPMAYHFKHYHAPFAAVARSNKTYFHSQQTGRIIEKQPCSSYVEPACFGFEPTSWTQWPSECLGACPIQGEIVTEEIVEMEQVPHPAPTPDLTEPESIDEMEVPTDLVEPPLQPTAPSPTIPSDVESAVPSPSDSSRTPSSARRKKLELYGTPPSNDQPALNSPEERAEIEQHVSAVSYESPIKSGGAAVARKVIPLPTDNGRAAGVPKTDVPSGFDRQPTPSKGQWHSSPVISPLSESKVRRRQGSTMGVVTRFPVENQSMEHASTNAPALNRTDNSKVTKPGPERATMETTLARGSYAPAAAIVQQEKLDGDAPVRAMVGPPATLRWYDAAKPVEKPAKSDARQSDDSARKTIKLPEPNFVPAPSVSRVPAPTSTTTAVTVSQGAAPTSVPATQAGPQKTATVSPADLSKSAGGLERGTVVWSSPATLPSAVSSGATKTLPASVPAEIEAAKSGAAKSGDATVKFSASTEPSIPTTKVSGKNASVRFR